MDIQKFRDEIRALTDENDKEGVYQSLKDAAETFRQRGVDDQTIIDHLSDIVFELRNNYGD